MPEEEPCEFAISGDICGLDKGKRDLIVGSFFGGTANPPECASGAKLSLAPSFSIQIWKMLGKRATASQYQLMRLEIVSVNRLLQLPTLSITTSRLNSSVIKLPTQNPTLRRRSTEISSRDG